MMRTNGWKTVWQRIVFIAHSGQIPPGMKNTTTLAMTASASRARRMGLFFTREEAPYSAMRPTALPATMFWHWWQCIHEPSARCSHAEKTVTPPASSRALRAAGTRGMMTSFFATVSIP